MEKSEKMSKYKRRRSSPQIKSKERSTAKFLWKGRMNIEKSIQTKDIIFTSIFIILFGISMSFFSYLYSISFALFINIIFLFILGSIKILKNGNRIFPLRIKDIIHQKSETDNIKYFFLLDKKNKPLIDILFTDDGLKTTAIYLFKIINPPTYIFSNFDDFMRGVYIKKDIPIFWYQIQEAIEYKKFVKLECIKDKAKERLKVYPQEKRSNRLSGPGGIWATNIIFGTKYIFGTNATIEKLKQSYREVMISRDKLITNFKATFTDIPFTQLNKKDFIKLIKSICISDKDSIFYLTGLENISHFLRIPKMAIKSMSSSYPAEFTVPTDIECDIPIGYSIEPEFQSIERVMGFSSNAINKGILTTGDSPIERFKINTKILYESLIQEYPFIIITSNTNYRKMIQCIPDITIFPANSYGIDIFNDEGLGRNQYISELEKVFKISLPLNPEDPLNSLIIDVYSERDLTLNSFLKVIDDRLKNEGASMSYSDRQSINSLKNLIEILTKSESASFFALKNIKINKLLHNSVFEIDIRHRDTRRLMIMLLLLKIVAKAQVDTEFGRNLIVLIDDADFIFQKGTNYRKNITEIDSQSLEFVKYLKSSGVIPFLSLENPKDIIPDILMQTPNIITSRMMTFNNIMGIRQALNLKSGRGETSEEHEPALYSDNRKYGYQFEYISDMKENEAIFKRPDIRNCFPIKINPLNFNGEIYDDNQIINRMRGQIPQYYTPLETPDYQSRLEKDFYKNQEEIKNIIEILQILIEYPTMMLSALISATGINKKYLLFYLGKLSKLKYIKYERISTGTHSRGEYVITRKGREIYEEYIKLEPKNEQGVEIY